MFDKIRKFGKRAKKYMNEKIEACKDFLSNDKNRLIVGLIIFGTGVGLGGGLIASVYIRVPV